MAALTLILPYQWRSYWRALRTKGIWKGANMVSLVMFTAIMLPVFLLACVGAVGLMRDPERAALGGRLLEFLASALFGAWLVMPILTSGVMARGEGISAVRLLRFPLGPLTLFLVSAVGVLIQPVYWAVLVASAALLIALGATSHPGPAILGGVLFITSGAVLSWGIGLAGSALFTSRRGRDLAVLILCLFLFSFLLFALVDVESDESGITLTMGEREILLANRAGTEGLLVSASRWLPGHMLYLVTMGEALRGLPPLIALTLACGALSLWAFWRTVRNPVMGTGATGRARTRAIGGWPFLKPAVGAATEKEFRYLMRTLDGLLGLIMSSGVAIYLLLRADASLWFLFLCVALVIYTVVAVPFNAFGLDGRGVDRYRLTPLSGREIFISKNLAYFSVTALQLSPLWAVSLWRFGWMMTVGSILGAAYICFALAAWGNQISVREPAPRQFFNLDSKEQAGGFLSMILAAVLIGVMLLVVVMAEEEGIIVLLGEAGVAGTAFIIYAAALRRAGPLFESAAETMRSRLSG